ncbi:superoxide dismutase [uncultured Phocaeicola sp.]|uniref:superoxide dismutase n=1 Tax=uncultured Phocaeicola sp. TaxID=990718 RepID=UPI0030C68B0C
MTHTMPELPYPMEALAPHMSKETLDYHYGKHLQTYVDNLNKLIPGTPYENSTLEEMVCKAEGPVFNNAAQAWNHTFFFQSLTPAQAEMPASLQEALTRDFGSVEAFKEAFTKSAVGLFGSGWAWLVADAQGKLSIKAESNAGNPLRQGLKPVLVVDVWEHAYYIDYRNRRAAFVEAFWKLVDWEKVAARC